MAYAKIKLDKAGLAEVLNSPKVTGEAQSLAGMVQANASGETAGGEPIDVVTRTRVASGGRLASPRNAVDVSLAHPAGLRVEALRGTLVRAAAAAGLEVKGR